jgi:hypothetical protein
MHSAIAKLGLDGSNASLCLVERPSNFTLSKLSVGTVLEPHERETNIKSQPVLLKVGTAPDESGRSHICLDEGENPVS